MPAIPILAAVGGGSALAGGAALASAGAGVYSAVKGADQARKAANQANDLAKAAAAGTGGGAVNIAALDQQARDLAQRNAAESAALEARYNPGAAELRAGSLQSVLDGLPRSPETERLSALIMAQAGNPLTAPATQQFDSALTRQAVEQAAADLALGGELPQDVRNLVARTALARSGEVTGGLGLGRDITARDLGLTSLDLRNRRLATAAALGSQEAGLEGANANLRQQAGALGLQAQQYGRNNLFDSASFIQNMGSGDFARALAAAQLGQNIAAPMSGLDPGSVVNLAVGNSNLAATAGQNSAATAAQAANNKTALGGQLLGTGLGFIQNYLNRPAATTPTYVPPTTTVAGTTVPDYWKAYG